MDKISAALNTLLADAFALYLKTKNFHWHVSGRHFRDYHLMLDEQSDAIFATTDQLAERVRKLGGTTLRSIGQIGKLQTIKDNNESYVPPREMLRELMEDNKHVAAAMRKAHKLCDDHEDSGTAGLLETLHRRNRAPHLVPVRGQPPGRRQRGVTRVHSLENARSADGCAMPLARLRRRNDRNILANPGLADCSSSKCIFESVRNFCSPFFVSFRNMRLLSPSICDPPQQSELGDPIHQLDGGVMANQQEFRQIAHGNRLRAGKALDGEQCLVLLRRQAGLDGRPLR